MEVGIALKCMHKEISIQQGSYIASYICSFVAKYLQSFTFGYCSLKTHRQSTKAFSGTSTRFESILASIKIHMYKHYTAEGLITTCRYGRYCYMIIIVCIFAIACV